MSVFRRLLILLLTLTLISCATPQIQPRAPTQAVAELRRNDAVMSDGYVLPLTTWTATDQPKAIVLGLHGFNDYRMGFAPVGAYLALRGITFYAYDQRGFGATEHRGMWPGEEALTGDVRTMVALLRERHRGVPLYLMGESMGGAIAITTLANAQLDVDGVVLIAPAVWARRTMPLVQRFALWLMAHTRPGTTVTGKGLDIWPSDNREMLRRFSRDPMIIKGTRFDALYGVTDIMDEALRGSGKLDVPALILYGAHDQIVPKLPTCRMLAGLPRGDEREWRLVYYAKGYHMLTRDLQGETVLNDIAAWLADKRAPLPSGEEVLSDPIPFCASFIIPQDRSE